MASDIRIFKLVTGEVVMGKHDENKDMINEVATIQTVPLKQGGAQMLILPYGYPFENKFCGTIEGKNILYRYNNIPEELIKKYNETAANIAANDGIGKLQFASAPAPAQANENK